MTEKRVLFILFLLLSATLLSVAQEIDSLSVVRTQRQDTDSIRGIFPSLKWRDVKPQIGRVATNLAMGAVMKWAIVDVMKNNIHEMRPNRSANNSMPSRHAAWAYGLATTASDYLVPYSPFWGIGSHALAAGVGFQRMIAHKHYAGDVLAGAGIGIGTSVLSGQFTRMIFHAPGSYSFPKKVQGNSSLSFSTGASFPLAKTYGKISLGTALISQLRFSAGLDGPWALNGSVFMQTAPLKSEEYFLGVLTHVGAGLGGAYSCPINGTPLEFSSSASAGVRYAFSPKHVDVRRVSPYADVDARLQMHLTDRFTVGAQVGFSLSSLALAKEDAPYTSRALSAVKCSFITIAHF